MNSWDLLEGGQSLLAAVRDGATVAFRDGATLPDARVEAELEQAGPSLVIDGSAALTGELTACRAAGAIHASGEETSFNAPALRWRGEIDGDGIFRSISILLEDGELVALRTHGRDGDAHGDEERAGAFTRGRKGQIDVAEVLLSTEYGADGMQRRATLELWPGGDDEPPCRGAGTVLCAANQEENGTRRSVAFFAWSVEGRAGLGRYEIARPA